MSDDRLDDEAPPDIPDVNSDPGANAAKPAAPGEAEAAPRAAGESDPGLDVDIDVEFPSDPGEPVESVEVVEEESGPPRRRQRVPTNPATPIARASAPPPPPDEQVEVLEPAGIAAPPPPSEALSVPKPPPPPSAVKPPPPSASPSPPAVAAPPVSASSPPPRPVSHPPRPVSQPPRPLSDPPRPKLDSEPPTEPWHPPPEPPEEGQPAATSYPPPPMGEAAPGPSEEAPPQSVKPMRMIRLDGPGKPAATGPAAAPPARPPEPPTEPKPAVAEDESDSEVAPASGESLDDSDISFPAEETDEDLDDELTEDDITPAAPGVADIPVDIDDGSGEAPLAGASVDQQAAEAAPKVAPPPPPRREAKPVTPPSALDIKEAKEAQRAKQRKAWWEELFGEDFGRANARLKSAQITHEADFIEESLGVAKGGVILDLACGSGHHAVELAKRGYGVVGYDLSLYQLAVAADVAQDAGQKLNLLQGDMREMAFEEMFDGIYCWNTSFGYFEEEKNLAVAQRVFRALRPGGMFLLDVANRDFVVDHQPSQTWFEGDGSVCMDDMNVDFITSRLRVKRSLILDDGRTLECAYSIRLYSLHELGKVLHDVGFRVTEASGHPATPGVFFGASSPRIIILAQRP